MALTRRRIVLLAIAIVLLPWLLSEATYGCLLATLPGRPEKTNASLPTLTASALWASVEDGAPTLERASLWEYVAKSRGPKGRTATSMVAARYIADSRLQESWLHSKWGGSLRWNATMAALMVWISRHWTAEEVIASWANGAYFGDDRHGIEAASAYYFGRSSAALAPEEAALLAAVSRSPHAFDPACHADATKRARDAVLDRMHAAGLLDSTAASRAKEQPVSVRPVCVTTQASSERGRGIALPE